MNNQANFKNKKLVKQFMIGKSDKEIALYNFRSEFKTFSTIEGILGFKEYKQAFRKGSNFDCDRCDLVMSIWCVLLESDENVKSVNGYTKREIEYVDVKDKKITIETDTINSLETDLNAYIRNFIESKYEYKWHELYSRGAGLEGGMVVEGVIPEKYRKISEFNRDKWLIDYYPQIFIKGKLTDSENELLEAYERYSNLTHTIGNFMIGPVGFNYSDVKAKSKSSDRVDIFLGKVKELDEYSGWKHWFDVYMNSNLMDMYFLESLNGNWKNSELKDLREGNTVEWINRINELIEVRGIKIVKKLRSLLCSQS